MNVKYAGPRPVISEHGVSFKDGKDDKYIYLETSLQLLNSLNHHYQKGRIYKEDIEKTPISDKDIEKAVSQFQNDISNIVQKEIEAYKKHLDDEVLNIKQSYPLLNELELKALKNNYKIMKEYRIQRAINKVYYMHILEAIAKQVKKEKIRCISTPFNEKFWHILQTLEGKLAEGKSPIRSKLKELEDKTLELKIDII